MKVGLILLVVMLAASCASRTALNSPSRITLPQAPKRIAVYQDSMKRLAGVEYIDPVLRVEHGKCDGVPETGGALLTPRSWRAVKYALTEWPRWGDAVRSIVDSHNNAVGPQLDKKPWWSRAWW